MIIETRIAKSKPKNVLAGAIYIAIEQAERFDTPLIIKDKSGRIKEVSPAQMRRMLKKRK